MPTHQREDSRAAKKRQGAETAASLTAPPVSAVSASDQAPAAATSTLYVNQRDDRRAARRSQMPAKAMSAVQAHKYEVGQVVNFTPSAPNLGASLGLYEIVRHLPPEGPDNQYRIKSLTDSHERVVRESQLA